MSIQVSAFVRNGAKRMRTCTRIGVQEAHVQRTANIRALMAIPVHVLEVFAWPQPQRRHRCALRPMRHLILYLSDKSVSAVLVKLVHTRGVQNACNLTPELVAWLVASVFVRSTLHNVGKWWYRRPSIG
jgi:hypothetical protein